MVDHQNSYKSLKYVTADYYTSSKFLPYITIEFGRKYIDQSPIAIHDG